MQGGNEIVVSNCAFGSTVDPHSGLESWSGRFSRPDPNHGLEAGEAILILPTGETGRVIITHLTIGSLTHGSFVGNGPTPSRP